MCDTSQSLATLIAAFKLAGNSADHEQLPLELGEEPDCWRSMVLLTHLLDAMSPPSIAEAYEAFTQAKEKGGSDHDAVAEAVVAGTFNEAVINLLLGGMQTLESEQRPRAGNEFAGGSAHD